MSSRNSSSSLPFRTLGQKLKAARQQLHETIEDVSGAVEIDKKSLERIEQGQDRPAEDILLLLINHFNMPEKEATALWQMAGYELPKAEPEFEDVVERSMVILMPIDPRVMYSDGVQVTANDSGVVMGFTQGAGKRQLTAGRIGMSREQAWKVVRVLQKTLEVSEQNSGLRSSIETSRKPKELGEK
ncbi:MAG TPA: helix-turn-helix transcriptional regulator [Candidatus Saccharimonadales bacterium]|nr:helix-turn-helix transcriptional regulator [Candidatus Saccharimonadales bacterium]